MNRQDVFMYDPIENIRGLDKEVKAKLRAHGLKYTQQLLEQGRTKQQREELAHNVGLPLQTIERLVGRADLMRLRGIGGDLSYLLEVAGVRSCRQLKEQQPEILHKRLAEIHIGQRIAYHAPSPAQVRSWINEAKALADTSPE